MGLNISILIDGTPDQELAQSDRVEIVQQMGQMTQYTIHYSIDVEEGEIQRLMESRVGPGSIMTILVPDAGGLMKCLVKGPVYSQEIMLKHGGAGSEVQVQGADSTIIMEREFKSKLWSNVTDSEVVTTIVSDYQLIPSVTSTNTRHLENNHNLVQCSNDLQFIRRLAKRNGYVFWVSCNELGIETAYFQRPRLDQQPVVDLVINHKENNIQQLNINWNVERPTQVVGIQLDSINKQNLDSGLIGAPQTSLGNRSFSEIAGNEIRTTHVVAPSDDGGDMRARGEGALLDSDWFIKASCTGTFHKINKVIQVFDLVNVVGAGSRHSGKYLVSGVQHLIDATEHKMHIELIRNGWE